MLEYSLIKQHRPRFNVRLRDDKSYPFLAVTLDDEWPRAMVMRGRKRKGVRYFGPYAHAYAIRDTLDLLLRTLPDPHLLAEQVPPAPAARPPVPPVPHREVLGTVRRRDRPRRRTTRWSRSSSTSSTGTPTPSSSACRAEMRSAADEQEYEQAARVRDRLTAVQQGHRASSRWWPTATRTSTSSASREDDLEAAVQVFYVRRGRVVGRKGFILDKVEDARRPTPSSPASSRSCTATSRPSGCRSRCSSRSCPRRRTCTRSGWPSSAQSRVADPCAAAGRQARPAGHRHPQRAGGVHPAPAASGDRPQQPGPGPQRAPGPARRSPTRRCASSATTWPTSRARTTSGRWS